MQPSSWNRPSSQTRPMADPFAPRSSQPQTGDPFAPRNPPANTFGNQSQNDPFAPRPAQFGSRPAPRFPTQSFNRNQTNPDPFAPRNNSFIPPTSRQDPFQSTQYRAPATAPQDPFAAQPNWNNSRHASGRHYSAPASAAAQQDPFARNVPRHDHPPPQHDRPRTLSTQILVKAVPIPLFSKQALQHHFEQFQDVHPVSISLRGSLEHDARRTALVSFNTPQETSIAMSRARMFQGMPLSMSYFRPPERNNMQGVERAPHPSGDDTQLSNELLFSYVPPDLFSEEAIRHLFNSISGNRVVYVSTRNRRFRGTIKRTAIVEFEDVKAAKTAFENLPLYNGQVLQVSYRSRPPHLRRRQHDNDSTASQPVDDMPFADDSSRMQDVFSVDDDDKDAHVDDAYEQTPTEDVSESGKLETGRNTVDRQTERELEMARLRLRIKEKENAKRAQNERQKRKKNNSSRSEQEEEQRSNQLASKQMYANRKEALRGTTRDESVSDGVWRNVGEKVDIQDAVQFVGTCETMCPKKEYSDRVYQKDISLLETVDNLGKKPDPNKVVKKYKRSAAISEQPSPEDIRPPQVLLKTMDHLRGLCDLEDITFTEVHSFVRDRTRSVRQDFTFQGVTDETCIKIHEECVRFHILSEHRLVGADPALFSSKQNREQLDKCLISLREMYDLRREQRLPTSPNESEMQSYYILMQMSKPKTCVQLFTGFASDVRRSVYVQFALEVVKAASEPFGNHVGYFAFARAAPYLMACLMQSRFLKMRGDALRLLNSTHGNPTSRDAIEISTLTRQLEFADDVETEKFCIHMGIDIVETGKLGADAPVKMVSVPSDGFSPSQIETWALQGPEEAIEEKVKSFSPSQIISGVGRDMFDLSKLPYCSSSYLQKLLRPKKRVRNEAREEEEEELKVSSAEEATEKEQKVVQKKVRQKKVTSPQEKLEPQNVKQSVAPTTLAFGSLLSKPEAQAAAVQKPPIKPLAFTEEKNVGPSLGLQRLSPLKRKRKLPSAPFGSVPGVLKPADATIGHPTAFSVPHTAVIIRSGEAASPPKEPTGRVSPNQRNRFPAGAISPRRREAERRRQEQVAAAREKAKKAERQRQEQILLAQADVELARAELTAHRQFMNVAIRIYNRCNEIQSELEAIKERFGKVSVEMEGGPKVLEYCDEADTTFNRLAKELKEHEKKVDEAPEPPTPVGKQRKEELLEKIRDLAMFGHKTWHYVWLIRGIAITAPEGLEIRTRRVERLKKSSNSPYRSKRKATMDNEIREDDSRKKKPRDLVGGERPESDKVGARAREWKYFEGDVVWAAMRDAGLMRWECVMLDTRRNRSEDEQLLYDWAKKRFSRKGPFPQGVMYRMSANSDGEKPVFLTVREAKGGEAVSGRTNVVLFCMDALSKEGYVSSKELLEVELRKVKERRVESGYPAPSVVVLRVESFWREDEAVSVESMRKDLLRLCDKDLLGYLHIVSVNRSLARYEETTRDFLQSLIRTVFQTAQGMKDKGVEVKELKLGSLLVEVGSSAWMKCLGDLVSKGGEEFYHEVIDTVNSWWRRVGDCIEKEAKNWPAELGEHRKVLDRAKRIVKEKACLPTMKELGAQNAKDYIDRLGQVTGTVVIGMEHEIVRAHATFCRRLGQLLGPFLRLALGDDDFNLRVCLGNDCVSANVTSRPSHVKHLFGVSREEERPRSRMMSVGMEGEKRRRTLPADMGRRDSGWARRMYKVYDEACKIEEGHAVVIAETIARLRGELRRASGAQA